MTLRSHSCVNFFLYTNDPTHGAMVEAREAGDASVNWMTQDPKAQQLAGVWSHSHSLWLSREHQRARDLASALEATCFNGEAEPAAAEPPEQEPAHDWGQHRPG